MNQIFWMVRCLLCGYYSGCFAGVFSVATILDVLLGVLVWLLFGDDVHSSESHCDTARPTATET